MGTYHRKPSTRESAVGVEPGIATVGANAGVGHGFPPGRRNLALSMSDRWLRPGTHARTSCPRPKQSKEGPKLVALRVCML